MNISGKNLVVVGGGNGVDRQVVFELLKRVRALQRSANFRDV